MGLVYLLTFGWFLCHNRNIDISFWLISMFCLTWYGKLVGQYTGSSHGCYRDLRHIGSLQIPTGFNVWSSGPRGAPKFMWCDESLCWNMLEILLYAWCPWLKKIKDKLQMTPSPLGFQTPGQEENLPKRPSEQVFGRLMMMMMMMMFFCLVTCC